MAAGYGARAGGRSVAHALDIAVVGTDIREDSRRYSVFIVEVRLLVCALLPLQFCMGRNEGGALCKARRAAPQ